MKKNFILYTLVVCCAIFIASCVTISKTESAATRNVVGLGVIQAPTMATLDVSSTKVTELFSIRAKNKFNFSFSFGKKSEAIAMSKDKALLNAYAHAVSKLLIKHNADVLIEPKYSFETMASRKTTTYNIIVSGYPATYKNFRPAVYADTSLFKMKPVNVEAIKYSGTLITE